MTACRIIAEDWGSRGTTHLVAEAIDILHEKFETDRPLRTGPTRNLSRFGVMPEERAMHKRRAFELVQKLLSLL